MGGGVPDRLLIGTGEGIGTGGGQGQGVVPGGGRGGEGVVMRSQVSGNPEPKSGSLGKLGGRSFARVCARKGMVPPDRHPRERGDPATSVGKAKVAGLPASLFRSSSAFAGMTVSIFSWMQLTAITTQKPFD